MITIPDVTNMSEADATAKLRNACVTGEISIARPSLKGTSVNQTLTGCAWASNGVPSAYKDGHVCYQHPVAGTRTRSRLVVRVELAERTSRMAAPIPNVVGMTSDAAKAKLVQAGFKTVEVQLVSDDGCKPGIVCRQRPEARRQGSFSMRKYIYVGKPAP